MSSTTKNRETTRTTRKPVTVDGFSIAATIGKGDRRVDIIHDGHAMVGDVSRERDPDTGRLVYQVRMLTERQGLVTLFWTNTPKSSEHLGLFAWARGRRLQREAEEAARLASRWVRPVAHPDGGPRINDCAMLMWRNVVDAVLHDPERKDDGYDIEAMRDQLYCAVAIVIRKMEASLAAFDRERFDVRTVIRDDGTAIYAA